MSSNNTLNGTESPEISVNLGQFSKAEVRILVVGPTGHGKSSLINAMLKEDVALVEHGASACKHDEYIMKYKSQYNGTTLYMYDTQGLGDANVSGEDIFKAIKNELKKVDLMLIHHRLYDRAEELEATVCVLKKIISQCGKDLLNRSVLCYTRADEYKVNDNSINIQKDSLTRNIKLILTESALTKEEFDAIPICITSTKESSLPFAPRWLSFFWECCIQRSSQNAKGFLSWYARNKVKVLTVGAASVGAVMGGTVVGGAIGSLVGTGVVPIPGLGTVVGAAVGAGIGGVTGGIVGTAGGGGTVKVAQKVAKGIGTVKVEQEVAKGIGTVKVAQKVAKRIKQARPRAHSRHLTEEERHLTKDPEESPEN